MKDYKNLLYFFLLAILIGGCSTKALQNDNDSSGERANKSSTFFQIEPSDKDLFDDALSILSNKEEKLNYVEAKTRLEKLVEQYPKSKWTPYALPLLGSLEKISTLQNQLKQERERALSDNGKLLKEIEGLKGSIKQTEERYSTEITKLQQENEQLRNDIQQLKKLEVQLEKREKMLR